MGLLPVPLERAGVEVEREHARRPEVLSRLPAELRVRVSGRAVDLVEPEVDRGPAPGAASTERRLGGVPPGEDVRQLGRVGRREPTPDELPGLQVDRVHVPAKRRAAPVRPAEDEAALARARARRAVGDRARLPGVPGELGHRRDLVRPQRRARLRVDRRDRPVLLAGRDPVAVREPLGRVPEDQLRRRRAPARWAWAAGRRTSTESSRSSGSSATTPASAATNIVPLASGRFFLAPLTTIGVPCIGPL